MVLEFAVVVMFFLRAAAGLSDTAPFRIKSPPEAVSRCAFVCFVHFVVNSYCMVSAEKDFYRSNSRCAGVD